MEAAAATVKKVFLELGGKSANIILDDAPFEQVLPFGATVCTHAGQGCALQTRLLLPRARYEEGLEMLEAAFENFPYGDPTDPGKLMGPQVSRKQQERVLYYIEKGIEEGARVVTGGGVPAHLLQGLLRRAHPARRRGPRLHRRPGGDLRTGALRHPLRGRGGRRSDREQLHLRSLGRRDAVRARSGRSRWRGAFAPAPSRSTGASGTTWIHPSAATGRAASGARAACSGSRSTSRPR